MKKLLKYFFVLVFVPAVVLAASSNVANVDKKSSSETLSRPFIVEEVSPSGEILSTKSGISSQTDPFLISQDLSANPYPEDRFSAFPDIKMNIGSKITLYRAPVYYLKDGKKNFEFRSWQKTVGELLAEKKIELGQDDKINFSASTELEGEMRIVINRVAITTVIEPEVINYETIKKSNPNVEKGNKKTLQAGKNGKKNKFYLVTREDGEEVSRKFIKSEVAEAPTDEILEVGTKVVVYGSGVASIWKASGEMVSACNFVSRGTRVHVVNLDNGKSVDVTCMGGGLRSDRIVDLSDTAFLALGGSWSQGLLKNVRVEKYYSE